MTGPDHIQYEATIDDPKTFSRPWTMAMPLYRHVNAERAARPVQVRGVRRRADVRPPAQDAAAVSPERGCDDATTSRHARRARRGALAPRRRWLPVGAQAPAAGDPPASPRPLDAAAHARRPSRSAGQLDQRHASRRSSVRRASRRRSRRTPSPRSRRAWPTASSGSRRRAIRTAPRRRRAATAPPARPATSAATTTSGSTPASAWRS